MYKVTSRGGSLVEILVALGIILLVVSGLTYAQTTFIQISLGNINKIKAAFLLEEGSEALKLLRDTSFSTNLASLGVDDVRYLNWGANGWQLSTSNEYIDGFERKIIFDTVFRDNFTDRISTSGTVDENTKKALISVSWKTSEATTTETMTTYVHNIYNN